MSEPGLGLIEITAPVHPEPATCYAFVPDPGVPSGWRRCRLAPARWRDRWLVCTVHARSATFVGQIARYYAPGT